jgi:site-specific DNA recombinase
MALSIIYARKSTESEDRQVLSIDSQLQELKLLALRRGLAAPEILTEAHSAKAPGRPVFGALMKRVNRGEVHSLVCWKLDRLARNHLDHGAVLHSLHAGKLQAIITPDRTYTGDGNDRFLGNFEFGMATKYIDDLRQNVQRGNRARFQRGWPNYRPPPGYLEDRTTKTVIKDPERFDQVRRMWDMVLGGTNPRQVMRIARDEMGFRSRQTAHTGGKPLSASQLYRLFDNQFYMGLLRRSTGEVYRGAHEPMITPEEFQRVQEILGRPGRARPSKHEFPYAGMIFCGRCGCVMTAELHVKPSGRRYTYYRCHGKLHAGPCGEKRMPEKVLDQNLLEALRHLAIHAKAAAWIEETVGPSLLTKSDQVKTARRALEQALQSAAHESDELLNLRLRSQVDDESFERKRLEILDRQAQLQLQLEQPEVCPEEQLERLKRVLRFSVAAPRMFEIGDGVLRRQILETMTSNWKVKDGKPLYLAKKPFSFLADATSRPRWWATACLVRTWLLETREFLVPDLKVEETSEGSVTEKKKAA